MKKHEVFVARAFALAPAMALAPAIAGTLFYFCATPARAERPRVYAITGAKIHVAPGQVLDPATIVLRDGLIEAVGRDVPIPPDAVVVDGKGKTVHAGFIDACAEIGQPKSGNGGAGGGSPGASRGGSGESASAGAAHPIAGIRPERRVIDSLAPVERDLEKHRGMGFTAALVVPGRGLFRGTSALVSLGAGPVAGNIIRPDVAQHIGFEFNSFGDDYPTSLMGAIAAIRQGLEDAKRHEVWQSRYDANPAGMKRPDMLSAYTPLTQVSDGKIPVIFDATTPAAVLRSLAIGKEFGLAGIVIGSGSDSTVIDQIVPYGRPMILPLAYPERPELDQADDLPDVETRGLARYLDAPRNAEILQTAGVPFAIGTCRNRNLADFPGNLRKAIDAGLSNEAALAALTTAPAKLFGVDRSMGTLEAGKTANVIVESGELFDEKSKVVRAYVDGVEYVIEEKKHKGDPAAKAEPRGTWSVAWNISAKSFARTWIVTGEPGRFGGTAETGEGTVTFTSVTLAGNELTLVLPASGGGPSFELSVVITGDRFEGDGEFPDGTTFTLKGTRTAGPDGKSAEKDGVQ